MTGPGLRESEITSTDKPPLDSSTYREFFDYYAAQSESERTLKRFDGIIDTITSVLSQSGINRPLEVADIGCGAGTLSIKWALCGHHSHGIDINEPLVQLARERAAKANLELDFRVGTATDLPWADGSMDVCVVPELLEHVADWRSCVEECVRTLRENGVLFLTTTNKLCPKQDEFDLPLYSWYPAPMKRYFEKLARTTHPKIAGYAKYPATHWFTFYDLREYLDSIGLSARDRFDTLETGGRPRLVKSAVWAVRRFPPLRWIGHVLTPYTQVLAIKRQG